MDIIYQAANRQNYIDQGQSVNLMVHPDMSAKEINKFTLRLGNWAKVTILPTQHECGQNLSKKSEVAKHKIYN